MTDLVTPRTATIEGRRAIVETIDFGLPAKLPALLSSLFQLTVSADITPGGTSVSCEVWRTHRLLPFRFGRFFPTTGVRRGEVLDLQLRMCADCGAVEVRDVSLDTTVDGQRVPLGRAGAQRRDRIIGRYSGARTKGRAYQ